MEKLKKSVGIRARKARERLGYKNRESFAEILGVHSNTVGFLERGETWISPDLLVAYRDKVGIDPSELLGPEAPEISAEQVVSCLHDALSNAEFRAQLVVLLKTFRAGTLPKKA